MTVQIAVLKETQPGERRLAMVPSVVSKLTKLGAELSMQSGAGEAIKLPDPLFEHVRFVADPRQLVRDADIVLAVNAPPESIVRAMKPGGVLISFAYAAQHPELLRPLEEQKVTCFAMELIPRITRAQSMDALSSQAALAGYY
ncbi:MAG TPA: NAD(P)(+) transhydrogenase (Re/Si-specific) subunit alpha, partial [Burkholderiales bacterium]|nr:NAD(P)(+) transhydrogenase (Re/Si-specific) subunit alpha [Burkholderiales bacterium]